MNRSNVQRSMCWQKYFFFVVGDVFSLLSSCAADVFSSLSISLLNLLVFVFYENIEEGTIGDGLQLVGLRFLFPNHRGSVVGSV